MRLRVELSGPARWSDGLLTQRADGSVAVDPGFQHLLARHSLTPITALRLHLAEALTVEVPRVSRAMLGPFWFPGLTLPASTPDAALGSLVLHAALEVLGRDVQRSVHRDPWVPPRAGEIVPDGCGLFRERRLAASPPAVAGLREWARIRGSPIEVVPLLPRR